MQIQSRSDDFGSKVFIQDQSQSQVSSKKNKKEGSVVKNRYQGKFSIRIGFSLTLALLIIVSLLVASCAPTASPGGGTTQTSSGATSSTAAKSTIKLKVIFPQKESLQTGGFHAISINKGYYAAEGLEVEPIWTTGGGEQVQLIVSRDGDIAIQTGFASVVGAWKKGAPLTIISAAETGYFVSYWYAKADSPIKDFTQLSGKKVGFSNPGSGTHMALLALQNYYKSKGWESPVIVAAGDQPSNLAAVLTGQLDAGWAGYPVNIDLIEQGKIREVINIARDLPGYDEIVVRVNFANSELVKNNPDAIRRFLRVWQKVNNYYFSNTQEAFLIYSSFAQRPMASPFVTSQMPKYITEKSRRLAPIGNIEQAMQEAIAGKFISAPLTQEELKKLINLDLVPK